MKNISYNLVKKLREITGIGILDCKKEIIITNGDIKKAILNLRKRGAIKAEIKNIKKTNSGIILVSRKKDFCAILEINCETDFVANSKNFYQFGSKIIEYAIQNSCKSLEQLTTKFESLRIDLLNRVNENIKISRYNFIEDDILYSYIYRNKIGVLLSVEIKKYNKHDKYDNNILKQISMHIVAKNPKYLNFQDIPKNIINKEKSIQLELTKKLKKPQKFFQKIVRGKVRKFFSQIILMEQNFVMKENITINQLALKNNIIIKKFVRLEVGEI
ncbi:translation elongation factor Ts [Buchnera aphidicola (Chaitoregma tattakana)]|uniref:translation elongation factor Ts n=1 Tax=Buchnera aphidicola TaxID=9 RepID=UPI0031B80D5C